MATTMFDELMKRAMQQQDPNAGNEPQVTPAPTATAVPNLQAMARALAQRNAAQQVQR